MKLDVSKAESRRGNVAALEYKKGVLI